MRLEARSSDLQALAIFRECLRLGSEVRLPVLPDAPNEADGLPWLRSSSQI
jgi:hypothetical protein